LAKVCLPVNNAARASLGNQAELFVKPDQNQTVQKYGSLSRISGMFGRAPAVAISVYLLLLVTAGVYFQTAGHQFINFDDPAYVTANAHVSHGLTVRNIAWAFTAVESSNWHPLTWISHLIDVQLFGMNPRGHHLSSVSLHCAATLTLLLMLVRLSGAVWQSLFVATVFALHPLHVESVAWVAERKDVLSALFGFLTIYLYAGYLEHRGARRYLLTLLCFVLGLMAKPMLVTLPLILLLLDYWPLGRYHAGSGGEQPLLLATFRTLLREKLPFLLCSLLSGLITLYAQRQGGALQDLTDTSLLLRSENALTAYVAYIGKALWPQELALLYPMPATIPLWRAAAACVLLLGSSVAVLRVVRRAPYLAVGWFWFIITMLPVIGIIQVGGQAMADRYSYIPLTGLSIMVAWGVADLTRQLPYRRWLLAGMAAVVTVALASLTWQQLRYWRDNITLYQHTLQVTNNNYLIQNNLGNALAQSGRIEEAINAYQSAIRISPSYTDAYTNLGTALQGKGDLRGALNIYQQALALQPRDEQIYYNIGIAQSAAGDMAAAIRAYRQAWQFRPDYADAANNLGITYARMGNVEAAIQVFRQLLQTVPDDADGHFNLGLALAKSGKRNEAMREYQETLRVDPDHARALVNLEQMRSGR
jgi:tetratricopeptide (TPR) repeat protein